MGPFGEVLFESFVAFGFFGVAVVVAGGDVCGVFVEEVAEEIECGFEFFVPA